MPIDLQFTFEFCLLRISRCDKRYFDASGGSHEIHARITSLYVVDRLNNLNNISTNGQTFAEFWMLNGGRLVPVDTAIFLESNNILESLFYQRNQWFQWRIWSEIGRISPFWCKNKKQPRHWSQQKNSVGRTKESSHPTIGEATVKTKKKCKKPNEGLPPDCDRSKKEVKSDCTTTCC